MEAKEGKKIKINVKQAADKKFEIELSETASISVVKEHCSKTVGCKPNDLKLIYKGFFVFD